MSVVSTRAVVLRATPYGETSQVVRVLTDQWGVVSGVARGARNRGRKGGGGWAPFSSGEITLNYRNGRDLQSFREYAPDRHRLRLASPPLRFAGASAFVEVLAKVAPEASELGLGSFAERRLDLLEEAAEDEVATRILESLWQLVGLLGFEPALDTCTHCQRPIEDEGMSRMDFERGGLRCPSCATSADSGPKVGPGARRQLREFLAGTSEGTEHVGPHMRLVSDFIQYHIGEGRTLRSFEFLLALSA